MLSPDVRLSCRLDQKPGSEREQQRLHALEELGLLEPESIPVFEEATQTAAHFLDAPICILGVLDSDRHLFKSAVGLSRIGLMNSLATSRQLPRTESFCTHVVDSQQVLMIPDAMVHPACVDSVLVQRYGIRSYLGVPLLTSQGYCVGTLAIMGLNPREFTHKEIEFLQLTARWSMSEFERDRLLKQPKAEPDSDRLLVEQPAHLVSDPSLALSAKTNLISQMTQELCTPLTSILGMASVLGQGIYGALSEKQREYIEIIHNSGQYLLSLVNEIVELGNLDDGRHSLNLSSVDIEMLCQQAITTLNQAAQRRDQQIQLSVEPGNRIWLLDKDKVRQMLYHLTFSVIQASTADSIIRIHVSRRQNCLNLAVWTSHPWLGDGLPQSDLISLSQFASVGSALDQNRFAPGYDRAPVWSVEDAGDAEFSTPKSQPLDPWDWVKQDGTRQSLGLVFSRQLAEIHGGSVTIRGSEADGYRYVIKLPQMQNLKEGL